MLKHIFFIAFIFLCQGGVAQIDACGLWFDSVQTCHFVKLDSKTGQSFSKSPLSNLTTIFSETAFVNPISNEYVFKGNSPVKRYFTIDIQTGSIVNDTVAQDNVLMLQVHPVTGVVYGIWFNNSVAHFVSVDTYSGIKTIIDSIPGVSSIFSETAFINPISNEYVFKGNNSVKRYFTIDIQTGSIVNDTVAQDNISMLQIHPVTGVVYGIWFNNNVAHFVSVDTYSGIKTIIDSIPGVSTIFSETAFINPISNEYVFKGNSPVKEYFTIDINSGTIKNKAVATENVEFLKYVSIPTSISEINVSKEIKVFPNPFTNSFTLSVSNEKFQNYSYRLFDMNGNIVRLENKVKCNDIDIQINNIPNGLYLLEIKIGSLIGKKVLIKD